MRGKRTIHAAAIAARSIPVYACQPRAGFLTCMDVDSRQTGWDNLHRVPAAGPGEAPDRGAGGQDA